MLGPAGNAQSLLRADWHSYGVGDVGWGKGAHHFLMSSRYRCSFLISFFKSASNFSF